MFWKSTRPQLEFDLLYLALLTMEGIKPLSRWEKRFENSEIRVLRKMGLHTEIVNRRLRNGGIREELIFSLQSEFIQEYLEEFKDQSLIKTPRVVRIEGRLFGYPECCVKQFIEAQYIHNSIEPEDQRILFHWACEECEITPLLIPTYRLTYRRANRMSEGLEPFPWEHYNVPLLKRYAGKSIAAVASFAILVTGCQNWPEGPSNDEIQIPERVHWLSVKGDLDRDGLTDILEPHFNFEPDVKDTDCDGVPDGRQLAKEMGKTIGKLPRSENSVSPYVKEHMAYGFEACSRCGETVNMGHVEIVNPIEETSIVIPYIGLHYLECGSFLYEGSIHESDIDIKLLDHILNTKGEWESHQLPIDDDADGDGLTHEEEVYFETDPECEDTDEDGLPDGVLLAGRMHYRVENLGTEESDIIPYRRDVWLRGNTSCPVCGDSMNMGYCEVINVRKNMCVQIRYIALHYMAHGSFSYIWNGVERIQPVELWQALERW
jgi:hypothetical protein